MAGEAVLASARASTPRRLTAAALLAVVGVVLARAGMALPLGSLPGALLVVAGGLLLWLGLRVALAPGQGIELTEAGLRETGGVTIAALSEIEAVDSSLLSARPSNGFLIRMRSRCAPAWRPGLWWRLGRRVGVGGILSKAEMRVMSDRLAALLADGNQTEPPSDQAT